MAKRAASDEKPFRPLDASVLQSVMRHSPSSVASAPTTPQVPRAVEPRVVELVTSAQRPQPTFEVPAQLSQFPDPLANRLEHEKRVLFTREEAHALDRLINNLAVRLNAQVKASHVIRALTTLLLHAETQVDLRANERGPLTRPANSEKAALQRFDREIASIFAHAIRDAGPPRSNG